MSEQWIAIGFVSVIVALAAWWWIPKLQVRNLQPQVTNPKEKADVEDNFRKSIGQLVGGAAILIGAWLAYDQTQATLQSSKASLLAQDEESKRAVVSQQVSKGFELLSEKDNPIKVLGGIYALEGVMNTSEQYHESVLDTLCAFVRVSTETSTGKGPSATAVQAALNVIKRRKPGPGKLVLSGAHIPKAVLDDTDLNGADLNGIDLSNAHAYGIVLTDGATLTDANLSGADMFNANLTGANLGKANLDKAQFISALLINTTLVNATLTGVNLNSANMTNADLNGVNFDNADLGDALNLTQSQLDVACGTKTKLPPKLTIKPCPPPK
jgi:uncharacterized protein YjbI with pentapeptide repeats